MKIYEIASNKINQIEAELKSLGDWHQAEPDPKIFHNMGAFGMNTMTPIMWLQYVLIPRVKEIIVNKGKFPEISSIAIWAARNFEEERFVLLNRLLSEFDDIFNGGRKQSSVIRRFLSRFK